MTDNANGPDTNAGPDATGLALPEAAASFAAMLTDDLTVGDTGTPRKDPQEGESRGEPNPDTSDTESDEDAAVRIAAGDEGEEGGDEGEPTPDKDGDEEGAKPAPEVFTVKVDGKEIEVSRDELLAGYQRQADYTRKTQAHAAEVKQFNESRNHFVTERAAVQQERAQYKAALGQLAALIDQAAPKEPDWQELYARDKEEFLIARDNWREIQAQKEAIAREHERVSQIEAADAQTALRQHIARGRAKLVEWRPEWKDEQLLRKDFGATMEYARNVLGYTDAELAQANDHRSLFAVDKARRYDELMAKAAAAKRDAKRAPEGGRKSLPAGSAGRTAQTVQTRSKQDGMRRLVKNGGQIEDAAALMADFL